MSMTPQTTPDRATQEQVLSEFRAWALSLSEDDLALLGIKGSIEEPMRLLRGFATRNGLTLR